MPAGIRALSLGAGGSVGGCDVAELSPAWLTTLTACTVDKGSLSTAPHALCRFESCGWVCVRMYFSATFTCLKTAMLWIEAGLL